VTDMPFKLSATTIAILRDVPVLQCNQCGEYVIEDPVMERVEALLEKVDQKLELEIVEFPAIEYNEDQLCKKMEKALRAFFRKDGKLLHVNTNERSISHKVAEHLQIQFPDMNVDCEYNGRGDRGEVKKSPGNQGKPKNQMRRVFPDLIVHKRLSDNNKCLVIEIKKKNGNLATDILKLKEFTDKDGYGYTVGLLLVFDVVKKKISKVLIYKDGKEEETDNKKWESLSGLVVPDLSLGQLSEELS